MEKSPQLLKSGSDNFKSKLKNLFDSLAVFEKDVNLPTEIPDELEANSPEWKTRARKNRKTTRAMRGQESLFKKPGLPPLRTKHSVPDFRRNPDRWKKYTLADVAPEDLTDASNTAAAFSFLNSRKEIMDVEDTSETTQVQFRKIVRNPPANLETGSSSATGGFVQSKLVMPEYVVGEKKVKPKRIVQKTAKKERELNLAHLHQFEDDE